MTGPMVTPDRETLAKALSDHVGYLHSRVVGGIFTLCGCTWESERFLGPASEAALAWEAHRNHQADALIASGAVTTAADAVRAWAEDEAVVERVARRLFLFTPDYAELAEARRYLLALAAALGGES